MKKIIFLVLFAVAFSAITVDAQAQIAGRDVYRPWLGYFSVQTAQELALKYIEDKLKLTPDTKITYKENGRYLSFISGNVTVNVDIYTRKVAHSTVTWTSPQTDVYCSDVTHLTTYDGNGKMVKDNTSWTQNYKGTSYFTGELTYLSPTKATYRQVAKMNYYGYYGHQQWTDEFCEMRNLDPKTGQVASKYTLWLHSDGMASITAYSRSHDSYTYYASGRVKSNDNMTYSYYSNGQLSSNSTRKTTYFDLDSPRYMNPYKEVRSESYSYEYDSKGRLAKVNTIRSNYEYEQVAGSSVTRSSRSWSDYVTTDRKGRVLSASGTVCFNDMIYNIKYDISEAGEVTRTRVMTGSSEVPGMGADGYVSSELVLQKFGGSMAGYKTSKDPFQGAETLQRMAIISELEARSQDTRFLNNMAIGNRFSSILDR